MSWNFSPVLVAAFLEECCLDTAQSVQSNTTPTPDQYYWPDKPTEHSRLSRFGTTGVPFEGSRGAELLTWYLAGFPAKTSALPEPEPALTEREADSGARWPGSLARYDRDTCSWKTAQRSLLGDSEPSLVTWPRSGLMLDGQCWELPTLERRIEGSESGYWPTPNAMLGTSDVNFRCSGDGRTKPNKLGWAVGEAMWPTPTVCGNNNRKGASATSGDGLATVVATRTWPTAYKGWSPNHNRANTDDRLDYTVEREAFQPGQQTPPMRLNPNWVEWLMGWPIGHTDLRPLGMDRCLYVEQLLGDCLMFGEFDGWLRHYSQILERRSQAPSATPVY